MVLATTCYLYPPPGLMQLLLINRSYNWRALTLLASVSGTSEVFLTTAASRQRPERRLPMRAADAVCCWMTMLPAITAFARLSLPLYQEH